MTVAMYDIVLWSHIVFATANIILVILADLMGLVWYFGKISILNGRFIKTIHWLVWIGLVGNVITGVFLFWPVREYLLSLPTFYVKIGLVSMLVINSYFIHKHVEVVTVYQSSELNKKTKNNLFLNAMISFVGWAGVLVCAFSLGL